jgi:hypothetical protein
LVTRHDGENLITLRQPTVNRRQPRVTAVKAPLRAQTRASTSARETVGAGRNRTPSPPQRSAITRRCQNKSRPDARTLYARRSTNTVNYSNALPLAQGVRLG